jgi:hypothetical protein
MWLDVAEPVREPEAVPPAGKSLRNGAGVDQADFVGTGRCPNRARLRHLASSRASDRYENTLQKACRKSIVDATHNGL